MGTVTRTLAGVLLLMSAVLPSACATPSEELPPPLSESEMAQIRQQESDAYWEYMVGTYPGTPRPEVEFVHYVTIRTVETVRQACMLVEGFDPEGSPDLSRVANLELASYVCDTKYPFDPRESGYLSDAQARFAYHYLARRIVPCLRTLGYVVPPPPTEDEFVANHRSGWTPYLSLDPQTVQDDLEFIDFQCPPLLADPYGPMFHPGSIDELPR